MAGSGEQWAGHFERLVNEGRAGIASVGERRYWVGAERAKSFIALFPNAEFAQALAEVETAQVWRDDECVYRDVQYPAPRWALRSGRGLD